MKHHTQIQLDGYIEFKGGVLKLSERKRAVYHKQRGTNSKSDNIVRTSIKKDALENKLAHRIDRATTQRESRRAKRK